MLILFYPLGTLNEELDMKSQKSSVFLYVQFDYKNGLSKKLIGYEVAKIKCLSLKLIQTNQSNAS
jgi:hypothetical protein